MMMQLLFTFVAIVGTVCSYLVARKLYGRIYIPLFLPIIVATVLIIAFLVLFQLSYEQYMVGGKWIHALLGPAVVALAYPLYEQRLLLKKLAVPILVGSFIGAVIGVVTGILLAKWARLDEELIFSVLPKSVTTPVAMDISESFGGIGPLAAVLVIIAGVTGVVCSTVIFRIFRLRSAVGKGVAFGAASHAIGTARALEEGELEGSISTIAMIVSAVFVSLISPIIVYLLM